MNKYCLLTVIFFYTITSSCFAQNSGNNIETDNLQDIVQTRPIEAVHDQVIDFVNVYPNELMESFVIDVYDRDFEQMTVIVKDETGKTILASYMQQVKAGEFKEFRLPQNLDREVFYVIIKTDNEELIKIFNT